MSNNDNGPLVSPYKFLHYYTQEDADIFFGRKAETRILLSDIVVARLVVLFAKTGTGKTSLINAGVRPILEERGYATFFFRVKEDPILSAKEEILRPKHEKRWGKKLSWTGETFAEQLANIASSDQLDRPVVYFFDQFEEFFIYPLKSEKHTGEDQTEQEQAEEEQRIKQQAANRLDFVRNIAALYYDPNARIHIVFSMREEWFVEMDIFRDEIPKIFHNDSNLRLRWFNESQAREAIKLPAEVFKVTIEDQVVDKMLAGLTINGEIEPAQLQIICDTLWRQTKGNRITLTDYLKLGEPRGEESITRAVLFNRLEKEFEDNLNDDHLHLLYSLLPKLRTPSKTKYVRDLPGLVRELIKDDDELAEIIKDTAAREELVEKVKNDEAAQLGPSQESDVKVGPLTELIEKLVEGTGLIRRSVRDGLNVIELSHDYLVDSLGDLQQRVKAIAPRRLLKVAMEAYGKDGKLIDREVLERISESSSILTFDREQAEVLFLSALAQGLETKLWFDRVPKETAWRILEDKISRIDESEHVIDLLGELQTDRTYELLEKTLSKVEIASYAIEVVCRNETAEAVGFLSKALEYESLMEQTRRVLLRIGKSRRRPAVAALARSALEQFDSKQRLRSSPGSEAKEIRSAADRSGEPLPVPPRIRGGGLSHSALEPHYQTVLKGFTEGRVVPLLGAGVHMADRHSGDWTPGANYLPTGDDLAQFLAKEMYVTGLRDMDDLTRVSQYVSIDRSQRVLYNEVRKIFTATYTPTSVHRFFAGLPGILREKGFPSEQLIITSNYDDMLEQAFSEAGESFDVISYIAQGEHKGKLLHRPFGEEPRPIIAPNQYRLPRGRSVILKLSGSVARENPELDSYVITEDHYIEMLTLPDAYSSMPIAIKAKLQKNNFLFLGYSLSNWNARVTLRRIWGEQYRSYKSWAIQPDADLMDQALWESRGIDLLNVPLADYINTISEQIKALTGK